MARRFMARPFIWRPCRHPRPPAAIGIEEFRRVIREEIEEALVPLADEITNLKNADDELATEVEALIADLSGEPQRVADAVAKALADAGVSTADAEAAITAATTSAQALVDRIKGVLAPPTPATDQTGSQTTGADTQAQGGDAGTSAG